MDFAVVEQLLSVVRDPRANDRARENAAVLLWMARERTPGIDREEVRAALLESRLHRWSALLRIES